MSPFWNRVLPVVVSIVIIIAVAILRQYSRTVAAVVATMPMNIPLGMWIVYAGDEDHQAALQEFNQAVLVTIIPTLLFMVTAWWVSRAGKGLAPTILSGYAVWGLGVGLIFLLRSQLGQ